MMIMINILECFFSLEVHAGLDRNPGLGNNTLLLGLIPGHIYRICPHRQFHTLSGLLHSHAALPNSNMSSREAVGTIL